jgi:hypothetical protein
VTGFPAGTGPETIVAIFHDLGLDIDTDCVRLPRHDEFSVPAATIKVEDPSFAQTLSASLKQQESALTAVPVTIDSRQRSCKKVYISWHKATRSVWLNYQSFAIAARVAKKFDAGTYTCLNQNVKSSPERCTVTLNGVPSGATRKNIEHAIKSLSDQPKHIEMGKINYSASDAEVSVEVRKRLEEYGRLTDFRLASASKGKRSKATAWFHDEGDARSACSLNNTQLEILGNGKLTVTLIHTARFKVFTTVYAALGSKIDEECDSLRKRHLTVNVYQDTLKPFTTLRVEGEDAKEVAVAQRKLDSVLEGIILKDGANPVWDPALASNGDAHAKLKSIEKNLGVVLNRDKFNHQIRFYGPSAKEHQALLQVIDMLKQESATALEINLNPSQFLWVVRGGFGRIEKALGRDCAVFNVVSKTILINGTRQQYAAALAMVKREDDSVVYATPDASSEKDCPICFCPAEDPVLTSCKHTYCLECLSNYCNSAASTSTGNFQITCQGNEGKCPTTFTLCELDGHLSSPIFEHILASSFKEYIARHPATFQYCPTPDCGFIYRSSASATTPSTFSCPHCFESVCTACHERHGALTCAEYTDISTNHEALAQLKRQLNIKDCPKCTTPMEKTEGCNHMTCLGCKAHICWVCMEVFENSTPCYDHMNRVHGSIGLNFDYLGL